MAECREAWGGDTQGSHAGEKKRKKQRKKKKRKNIWVNKQVSFSRMRQLHISVDSAEEGTGMQIDRQTNHIHFLGSVMDSDGGGSWTKNNWGPFLGCKLNEDGKYVGDLPELAGNPHLHSIIAQFGSTWWEQLDLGDMLPLNSHCSPSVKWCNHFLQFHISSYKNLFACHALLYPFLKKLSNYSKSFGFCIRVQICPASNHTDL